MADGVVNCEINKAIAAIHRTAIGGGDHFESFSNVLGKTCLNAVIGVHIKIS